MAIKKYCFIGVGSIAQRHIRNLSEILAENGVEAEIDVVRRNNTLEGLTVGSFIHKLFTSSDELDQYDAIFITNPNEYHMSTLNAVHDKAKSFFIEKPVSSVGRLSEAQTSPYLNDINCYVACPLRYKKVIQYVKQYAAGHHIIGVRAISSSYLPEWRPGQDYRSTYSAQKALGGGVSIDLIHEWDYLKYLFGEPKKVVYMSGRKSDLEIDVEDTALYMAEYEDKFIELHLDYFGRSTVRECMLFTQDDTVVADLIKNEIRFLKSGEVISFEENRDDFQKAELRHFLEIAAGAASDSTIFEAVQTMNLTQGIVM